MFQAPAASQLLPNNLAIPANHPPLRQLRGKQLVHRVIKIS